MTSSTTLSISFLTSLSCGYTTPEYLSPSFLLCLLCLRVSSEIDDGRKVYEVRFDVEGTEYDYEKAEETVKY